MMKTGMEYNPPKTPQRRHAVESAGYWFDAAKKAAKQGKMSDALLCMENAYNHVENALLALRDEKAK